MIINLKEDLRDYGIDSFNIINNGILVYYMNGDPKGIFYNKDNIPKELLLWLKMN